MKKYDEQWIQEVCTKINKKMTLVSERSANKIPYTTNASGIHDDKNTSDISWWTNGFWGGMLWLMYEDTKNQRFVELANRSEDMLDVALDDYYGLHHDVGFMWGPTSVSNYKFTQNPKSRKRALLSANLLAGRFNLNAGLIRAWNNMSPDQNNTGWAIIDCMMNIPLLYWASDETKDPRFKQIAMKHADTAMDAFIRPDGSVNHIVEFDPEDGTLVRTYGGQGYEEGSSWSRGQAWALYGFVLSYMHTKKPEYLDIAKRVAHYFIANVCDDWSPKVDFRAPKEPVLYDTTASAIASCALIEISKQVSVYEKDLYLNSAINLLKTLDTKFTDWSENTDNLLTMCSASYHDDTHHFSIIYGDAFFMEAMFKLKGNENFLW